MQRRARKWLNTIALYNENIPKVAIATCNNKYEKWFLLLIILYKKSSLTNYDFLFWSMYLSVGVGLIMMWIIIMRATPIKLMLTLWKSHMAIDATNSPIKLTTFRTCFILLDIAPSWSLAMCCFIDLESHVFSISDLGLSPNSVSTLILLYDLLSTVKSIGVYPLESGYDILTPYLAYSAITYGRSL